MESIRPGALFSWRKRKLYRIISRIPKRNGLQGYQWRTLRDSWAPYSQEDKPPKTNGGPGLQNDGPFGKGNGTLQKWQLLVSMLDFWSVDAWIPFTRKYTPEV